MHPVRRANMSIEESFNLLKPWIKHCHFHDGIIEDEEKVKLVPIGQGQIDHKKTVELLKSMNYNSFMSGEWINWEPYEKHLPREIATMKQYRGK
jgi:sugar phosphate isomerase/epimerase